MNKKRNARISKVENKSQEVGKRTKNRKKNERKNLVLNILLIIFIVVFIYSSYHVFMWIKSDRKIKKLESGLYKDVVEDVKDDEQPEIQVKITKKKLLIQLILKN